MTEIRTTAEAGAWNPQPLGPSGRELLSLPTTGGVLLSEAKVLVEAGELHEQWYAKLERLMDLRSRGAPLTQLAAEAGTTDTFSYMLGASTERTLLDAYNELPRAWEPFVKILSAKSFKTQHLNHRQSLKSVSHSGATSEDNLLPKVPEGRGFDEVQWTDNEITWKLDTYGCLFYLTREAIVNDDLNGFAELTRLLGRAIRRRENQLIANILENGTSTTYANCWDSNALYDATNHSNYGSAGTTLTHDNLTTAVEAMSKQTDESGNNAYARAKFLVVAPTEELTAKSLTQSQLLIASSLGSTSSRVGEGSTNVLASMGLQVVVFPELTTSGDWYLFSAPNEVAAIGMGYLNGKREPTFEVELQRANVAAALGQRHRVYHDFGAVCIDWRGTYKGDAA